MKKLLLLSLLILGGITAARAFPPYYAIADHDKAQVEARQRNLPLVWLVGWSADLTVNVAPSFGHAYLTQMAMSSLQNRAVVIVVDFEERNSLSPLLRKQVDMNEGDVLLRNPRVGLPKLIFTNPEATKPLGRVSRRQLVLERDVEINALLLTISSDPTALAKPTSEQIAAAAEAPPPAVAPPPTVPTDSPAPVTTAPPTDDTWIYVVIGLCMALVAYVMIRANMREPPDPHADESAPPPSD